MPLLLFPIVLLALLALLALLLPLSIVGRYRAGTARQRARPWLVLVNVIGLGISVFFFFVTAAVNSYWAPGAFSYSVAGFAGGAVLGIVGLRLTRWETASQSHFYTPNRWLVLAIMVGVTVRLGYGFWRMWHAWHTSSTGHSWVADSGLAGSMATGAVVLGYYLAFLMGVWWRVRQTPSTAP
jgi:hypothetical protein